MRPTEPEKRVWRSPSHARQAGVGFRRQAVAHRHIVDFLRSTKAFIVDLDRDCHDLRADRIRAAALQRKGVSVLRATHQDVMTNSAGGFGAIRAAVLSCAERWPYPSAEGEGLKR